MEKVIFIWLKIYKRTNYCQEMSPIMEIKNPTWKIIELNDDNLSEYINIEEEIPNIQKKNITKHLILIL